MRVAVLIAANFLREQRWVLVALVASVIVLSSLASWDTAATALDDVLYFLKQQALYGVAFSVFLASAARPVGQPRQRDASSSRPKSSPYAPSLPYLTKEEEGKLDKIIDRFMLYDIGRLQGEAARKALKDFKEVENVSSEQRAQRAAWLRGEAQNTQPSRSH